MMRKCFRVAQTFKRIKKCNASVRECKSEAGFVKIGKQTSCGGFLQTIDTVFCFVNIYS